MDQTMSNSNQDPWILNYPAFHFIWLLISLCICANLWSLNYFCKGFKILQHSVFIIHFVDLVMSILLPGFFILTLILSSLSTAFPGNCLCYIMYFAIYTPITLAPFCSALIAILRLKSLQLTKKNEDLATSWIARSIFPLFVVYFGLTFVLFYVHIHMDWPISFTTESCLHGPEGRNLRLETRLLNLLIFIPQAASVVGDFKIVLLLRSHNSETFQNRSAFTKANQMRDSITTVPVRATAMATGFFLVYVLGAGVTNLVDLDVNHKALALVIIGCTVNTLRHPLVALTTFRAYKEKEKKMLRIQRHKNLKREIECARKRRAANSQKVFVVSVETTF